MWSTLSALWRRFVDKLSRGWQRDEDEVAELVIVSSRPGNARFALLCFVRLIHTPRANLSTSRRRSSLLRTAFSDAATLVPSGGAGDEHQLPDRSVNESPALIIVPLAITAAMTVLLSVGAGPLLKLIRAAAG